MIMLFFYPNYVWPLWRYQFTPDILLIIWLLRHRSQYSSDATMVRLICATTLSRIKVNKFEQDQTKSA
jgi:hypothetical protein